MRLRDVPIVPIVSCRQGLYQAVEELTFRRGYRRIGDCTPMTLGLSAPDHNERIPHPRPVSSDEEKRWGEGTVSWSTVDH